MLTKLARRFGRKRILWLKHYKAYRARYPKTPPQQYILSQAKHNYLFARKAKESSRQALPINSNRWELFEIGMQENIA